MKTRAQRKAAKESRELAQKIKDSNLGGKQVLSSIDNITFNGEDLLDMPEDMRRPKAQKMFLIKRHIRLLPKAFTLMPNVSDFKVKKIQTMILLEVAREWTRRNMIMEGEVQKYRKSVDPEDTFDSHGFPKFGYDTLLNMATIFESDSFYDSRGTDLGLAFLSIHETCDLRWSKHMARCNKCNVDMDFVNGTEDKNGIFWMTFMCPQCKTSMSHGKDLYLNELVRMWYLNELVHHEVYRMQMHFRNDHPGKLKHLEYPALIKGCETCKEIDTERTNKLKETQAIYEKYIKLFHETFQIRNPFTGESYVKKEGTAASKAEELKDKRRRKKKKGAKK